MASQHSSSTSRIHQTLRYCTLCQCHLKVYQAANLAGFRASEDPRFEAGIPDFMNGILNFSIHFNVVHRKVDWRNPKMKSLNSMPVYINSQINLGRHGPNCLI